MNSLFLRADIYSGLAEVKHSEIKQENTSSFDVVAEDQRESWSRREQQVEEPEISILRNVVRHVPRERRPTQVRVVQRGFQASQQVASESSNGAMSSECAFSVPDVDWESEVSRVMLQDRSAANYNQTGSVRADAGSTATHASDRAGSKETGGARASSSAAAAAASSSSSAPTVLRRPLPLHAAGLDSNAPFDCFEVGNVGLTEADQCFDPLDAFIPNRGDILELSGRAVVPDMSEDSDSSSSSSSSSSSGSSSEEEADDTDQAGANESKQAAPFTVPAGGMPSNAPKLTKAEQKLIAKEERQRQAQARKDMLAKMSREDRLKWERARKEERLTSVGLSVGVNEAMSQSKLASRNDDDALSRKNKRAGAGGSGSAGAVSHSRIAQSHLNTRPDLQSFQLRYFHRPRLSKSNRCKPWKIFTDNSAAATSKGGPRRALGQGQDLVTNSGSNSLQSDHVNLSVSTGDYFLIEYVEEHPPIRLNYGMGSKLVNFYRAPDTRNHQDKVEAAENDALREREAATRQKRQKLLAQHHVPRHVRGLLQQRDNKQEYDYDANIPRLPVGETRVLGPTEESPFLGDLETEEIQPAIVNALYKAPLFERKTAKTDFLLVCTGATSEMHFVVRKIPRVFVSGQMEPLRKVFRPLRHVSNNMNANRVSEVQTKFMRLALSRIFGAHFANSHMEDGVPDSTIQREIFSDYTLNKAWSPQRESHRMHLQDLLFLYATKDRGRDEQVVRYRLKSSQSPESGLGIDLEIMNSPETIAKSFSPEDVCLEETAASAEFRLRELGIMEVFSLPEIWGWLQLMGRLRSHREYRAAYVQYQASEMRAEAKILHTRPRFQGAASQYIESERKAVYARAEALDRLRAVLVASICELDDKIDVARFIFDRLLSAPWNTTQAYVHSHVERDGLGRMEIDGPGDPSGCHNAYAFVRIDYPTSHTAAKKSSHEKIGSSNQDLRKLTTEEAIQLCVAFGISPADARNKLKRWDRVEVIRVLSTKAVESGAMGSNEAHHKYARSGTVNEGGSAKEVTFKQKCQDIWARQKHSLREINNSMQSMGLGGLKQKAAAAASGEGGASTVALNSAEHGEGHQSKADDDNDDDDDDDFDLGVEENFVEVCVSEKAKEIAEEKRKKRAVEAKQLHSAEEDRRQMQDLLKGLGSGAQASSVDAASSSAAIVTVSTSAGAGSALVPPAASSTHAPVMLGGMGASRAIMPSERNSANQPLKAVRKITRNVFKDGSEEIVVQFFVSDREVKRVIANKDRTARKVVQDEHGLSGRIRAHSVGEDEEDAIKAGASVPASATASNPLSLKVGKMRQLTQSGKDGQVHEDEYKTKQSTSRGSGFTNYRLPHVAFAAMLEKELLGMCTNKASPEFWQLFNPVPRTVPRYYEVIQRPICLSDIHNNICELKYLNYRMFCDDLDLMIYNACLFNGEQSKIALKAKDIKSRLCNGLELTRRHHGIEKCPLRNFDEVIKKKYLYLGRHIPQSVPLPKYNMAAAPAQAHLLPGSQAHHALPGSAATRVPSSGNLDSVPMQRAISFVPGKIGDANPSPDLGPSPSPGLASADYSPGLAYDYSPPASTGLGRGSNDYSPGRGSDYSPSGGGQMSDEYSPAAEHGEDGGDYSPLGTDTSPQASEAADTSPYQAGSDQSPYVTSQHGEGMDDAPPMRTVLSFAPGAVSAAALQSGAADDSNSDEDWMIPDDEEEDNGDDDGDGDGDDIGMDMGDGDEE